MLSNKANHTVKDNKERLERNLIPILDQSFSTAARHFNVIEEATQAVIVPFGEGDELIADLNSSAIEFDAGLYYETLRKAQRFSVNVYESDFRTLWAAGALEDINHNDKGRDGVYSVAKRHYDTALGLTVDSTGEDGTYSL